MECCHHSHNAPAVCRHNPYCRYAYAHLDGLDSGKIDENIINNNELQLKDIITPSKWRLNINDDHSIPLFTSK